MIFNSCIFLLIIIYSVRLTLASIKIFFDDKSSFIFCLLLPRMKIELVKLK
nr:MAG TPA: hypothetical protein [Caudoviricetes sp.]